MIVRAAVAGAFDFTTFDPKNRGQRQRLTWIINELERVARQASYQQEYAYFIELLRHPKLEGDNRTKVASAVTSLHAAITHAYCPWDKERDDVADKAAVANDMAAQYHAVFGKPGEPRYEKMIEESDKFYAKLRRERVRRNAKK